MTAQDGTTQDGSVSVTERDLAAGRRGSLLRDRDFAVLFAANAVSKFGTQISFLGLPAVASWELHASPGQVGVLGVLSTVAFLLIGLPAGAWVDRRRRRGIMIVSDVVRAATMGSVPVAWWLDGLTIEQLYVVVFVNGILTVFFDVAAQSYLPFVVRRDRLLEANAKLGSCEAAADVAGPSVAGFLIQLITAPVTIAVDAASYLWSAACLGRIRRREPVPEQEPARHMLKDVGEGAAFVTRHALLRPIAVMGAITNLSVYMITTMMPIVFRELGLSARDLGVFLTLGGVGVLLGVSTGRRVGARLGHGRSLWMLGVAGMPFALTLPFVSEGAGYWLAAFSWLAITYRIGMNNVVLVSFRQQVTPDRLLGRMNATMRFLLTGALAVGAAVAGTLGELGGVRAPLWAGALCLALVWVPIFFSPLRSMHELSTPASDEAPARPA